MSDIGDLFDKVVLWGQDKGLDKVGFLSQAEYTLDEISEILKGYAQNKPNDVYDGIGDTLVTLIVGASNDQHALLRFRSAVISASADPQRHVLLSNKRSRIVFASFGYSCDSVKFGRPFSDLVISADILVHMARVDAAITTIAKQHNECLLHLCSVLSMANNVLEEDRSLYDCLLMAYNEIKGRTGEIGPDGKFHKDGQC